MELTDLGVDGSPLLQLFKEAVIKAGFGEAFISYLIVARFIHIHYGG